MTLEKFCQLTLHHNPGSTGFHRAGVTLENIDVRAVAVQGKARAESLHFLSTEPLFLIPFGSLPAVQEVTGRRE